MQADLLYRTKYSSEHEYAGDKSGCFGPRSRTDRK